ncbi:type III effector protein [Ralstonia solanacearum]|uniref:type III effector protein n=1 Tax=Ralstonia solanacearum TaxID=305 RepID=UPI000811988D|nr:type III effector protein [Ralstonia solanacearum]
MIDTGRIGANRAPRISSTSSVGTSSPQVQEESAARRGAAPSGLLANLPKRDKTSRVSGGETSSHGRLAGSLGKLASALCFAPRAISGAAQSIRSKGSTFTLAIESQPRNVAAVLEWVQTAHVVFQQTQAATAANRSRRLSPVSAEALSHLPGNLSAVRTEGDSQLVLVDKHGLLADRLSNTRALGLAPDAVSSLNDVKHPAWPAEVQVLAPRVATVSATTMARLGIARTAIDAVKALLPYGAGNQVKDIARTNGESYVRAALANSEGFASQRRYSKPDRYIGYAAAAIKWQAGFCDQHAAIAYALLGAHPDLIHAQVDYVKHEKLNHMLVVIRGDRPENDIVVDPWAVFAVPALAGDVSERLGTLGARPSEASHSLIVNSKPAGEQLPPLDLARLRQRAQMPETRDPLAAYREKIIHIEPERALAVNLTDKERPAMFDVPYNGNPNVRYRVEDAEGTDVFRLDIQRMAARSRF